MKYKLGNKLREVREKRGVTMKSVASAVGISESMVSQIERNRVSPALDTLLDIIAFLQVEPEYIFSGVRAKRHVSIVRAGAAAEVKNGGIAYSQLVRAEAAADGPGIAAYALEIPPGREKGSLEQGHPGRELGIILSGRGELEIDGEVYALSEGDSVAFASHRPHIFRNIGEEMLRAHWIITPPRAAVEDF